MRLDTVSCPDAWESARDRAEIVEVLNRYQIYVDHREFRAYSELFAENGVNQSSCGSAEGREEIAAMSERLHASGFTEGMLAALGANVFGLATQSPDYLRREVERLHLPFDLLSDQDLALQQALRLPVFDVKVAGNTVLKRLTLICKDDEIIHVFYPVFPPDKSA